jgi:hypothetical protein
VVLLDAAETCPEGLLNAEAIFRSCRKLDKDLSTWLEEFEKNNPDARLPALPSNADPKSRLVFPWAYQFKNLKVAMLYLKYWATYTLLHGSLWRIDIFRQRMMADIAAGKAHSKGNTATSLFPAFDYARRIQHSIDICQSLDYVLDQIMTSSRSIYVTYPIVVAYVAFRFDPQCEAEADCCAKMMQEMEASRYCYTARYPDNVRKETLSLGQKYRQF